MSLQFFKKGALILGGIVIIVIIVVIARTALTKKPVVVEPTPVVVEEVVTKTISTIGTSVQGRKISKYSFGTGPTHIMFIGGIHGGYEWNSVVLANTFVTYLEQHPDFIPKDITIDVIPSLNPDGIYAVTGKEGVFTESDVSTDTLTLEKARFNANAVDINRNFDCTWKAKSTWKSKTVSAGYKVFSEPEAVALRDAVLALHPSAVIFWHSQSNAVYASQCEKGILPETLAIMNAYSQASGYEAVKTFDAYPVTGAAEDWMASVGIPAITVELKTHTDVEWDKNFAGVTAILKHYTK
jgi:predicted deacylase